MCAGSINRAYTISAGIAWAVLWGITAGTGWWTFVLSTSLHSSYRLWLTLLAVALLFVVLHLLFLPLWDGTVRLLTGKPPEPVSLDEVALAITLPAGLIAALTTWGLILLAGILFAVYTYLTFPSSYLLVRVGAAVLFGMTTIVLGAMFAELFFKMFAFFIMGGLTMELREEDEKVFPFRFMRRWQRLARRIYPVQSLRLPEDRVRQLVSSVIDGHIACFDRFAGLSRDLGGRVQERSIFDQLLATLQECVTPDGIFSEQLLLQHLREINDLTERLTASRSSQDSAERTGDNGSTGTSLAGEG